MTQTFNSMKNMEGMIVRVRCESWIIRMRVVYAKNTYGRNRLLVRPVELIDGGGKENQAWIDVSRVVEIEGLE